MSTYGIKNSLAKKFSVLFLTATSASHPIIYGALHQEFAQGFQAFLRCSKKARTDFTRMSTTIQKLSLDWNGSFQERAGNLLNLKIKHATEDSSSTEHVLRISAV